MLQLTLADLTYYDAAVRLAMRSGCTRRHGCIIVKQGKIVAAAVNTYRCTVPRRILKENITYHAERNAIKKARCDLYSTILYSARYGDSIVSKPCAECQALIVDAGIGVVVYSDGANLVKERVRLWISS